MLVKSLELELCSKKCRHTLHEHYDHTLQSTREPLPAHIHYSGIQLQAVMELNDSIHILRSLPVDSTGASRPILSCVSALAKAGSPPATAGSAPAIAGSAPATATGKAQAGPPDSPCRVVGTPTQPVGLGAGLRPAKQQASAVQEAVK